MTRASRARRWFAVPAAASVLLVTAACGSDDDPVDVPDQATSNQGGGDRGGSTQFAPGAYEALGSYNTPGGVQRVEVELELAEDGTITELDVDGKATGGNSVQFQGLFESGIEREVVGKKITELDVSHVAGSSLTSGGFNRAIDEIIAEARD